MKFNNAAVRIIVSIIAIPLIIGICYLGGYYFLAFTLGIGLISFYEFSLLAKNKDAYVNSIVGFVMTAFLIINSYFVFISFHYSILIGILLLLIYELFRDKSSAIINLGTTLLGIFYIGLFSSTLIGIREIYSGFSYEYQNGGLLIISMMITIWMCDSAAYFLGTAFGKHRLFPRVSPKKSWEGAVAGFIFSIATMIFMKSVLIDFLTMNQAITIGIIIGSFGQIGDLIESLIKRDANVKDSSDIIPGHGGILDRFDSLLYSAPIVFLYFSLFVIN
ncbi:MAG: phosphatidate cytidylyltransferase [Melioribacteraceae bacterium]|nr:phosphatidate cytidylyltransferase [Melioribacteraceae bacterium]